MPERMLVSYLFIVEYLGFDVTVKSHGFEIEGRDDEKLGEVDAEDYYSRVIAISGTHQIWNLQYKNIIVVDGLFASKDKTFGEFWARDFGLKKSQQWRWHAEKCRR